MECTIYWKALGQLFHPKCHRTVCQSMDGLSPQCPEVLAWKPAFISWFHSSLYRHCLIHILSLSTEFGNLHPMVSESSHPICIRFPKTLIPTGIQPCPGRTMRKQNWVTVGPSVSQALSVIKFTSPCTAEGKQSAVKVHLGGIAGCFIQGDENPRLHTGLGLPV